MNDLYLYILERLDKTMHEYNEMLKYSHDPYGAFQLYALAKTIHEQVEILLQITRCYKDQLEESLTTQKLEDLATLEMGEMDRFQKKFLEYVENLKANKDKDESYES